MHEKVRKNTWPILCPVCVNTFPAKEPEKITKNEIIMALKKM
jgi:hypothetical protein